MDGRRDGRVTLRQRDRVIPQSLGLSERNLRQSRELVIVLAGLGDDRRTLSVSLLHTRRENGSRGEGGKGSHADERDEREGISYPQKVCQLEQSALD